ncbi:MAG: hypothetical protein AW07_02017 [Candidatus Accumulibacter sp. SK-11]|nr:MAG: hypothetical protein AW07_02017 [Candidatus Accumulibacter sp. SK-11]
MCQPSASSAIELNHQPAAISTNIIAAVISITTRVPFSAARLPSSKTCVWLHGEFPVGCMAGPSGVRGTCRVP